MGASGDQAGNHAPSFVDVDSLAQGLALTKDHGVCT
jgi:hypothetical protein